MLARGADNPRLVADPPDHGVDPASVVADLEGGPLGQVIIVDASAAVLGCRATERPGRLSRARCWRRRTWSTPTSPTPCASGAGTWTPSTESGLRTRVRLGIERFPTVGLLDRVWELRENLTACESGYVARAEALDRPLSPPTVASVGGRAHLHGLVRT